MVVHKESCLGGSVKDPKEAGDEEPRSGQRHQSGGQEHRPDEHRHPRPSHSGRTVMDDGGGQVEPGHDHRDPDDGEADQVAIDARHVLGLERSVAGPTGVETPESKGGDDAHQAGNEHPERGGFNAGECHPPGSDHERYKVIAQRPQDQRTGHHHHDRPVGTDDLQVDVRADDVIGRRQQLRADAHGQEATGEEE